MSIDLIRTALETALDALSPAIATVKDNTEYAPVDGTPYQEVLLRPLPPIHNEQSRSYIQKGVLLVVLYYMPKVGAGAAQTRASAIRAAFYNGRTLTASGQKVHIDGAPDIAEGRNNRFGRWVVPVTIRFWAPVTVS